MYELKYITKIIINKEKNEIYDEPVSVFLNTREEAENLKLKIDALSILPRDEWTQLNKHIEGTTNWDRITNIRFVSIKEVIKK